MKIHFSNSAFLFGSIAFAAAVMFAAQASSPFDIQFPIAELGNCADKIACKAYCDVPDHQSACQTFAEKHGLGGSAKGEKNVDEFITAMEADGGPDGQCGKANDPIHACELVCSKRENMRQCMKWALGHDVMRGTERAEMEKVLEALERGIELPAGCSDEKSCKETCEHPKNKGTARQCFAFAKEAKLLPPEFDDEKAERMFELIDSGEVDFGAMKKCEKMDEGGDIDEVTLDQCLAVGEKLGFMKAEEKEFAKKMMRDGGPNGCRGKQCKDVCEQNPEVCLKYFEEKGIALPAEAQEKMRSGSEQMKRALGEAPPEVLDCLKAEIGPDRYDAIQAGTIKMSEMATLGPRMGTIMQQCFMKMSGGRGMEGGFSPPDGEVPGGEHGRFAMPEGDDVMKKCFEEQGMEFPPRKVPPPGFEEKVRECVTRERGGHDGRSIGEGGFHPPEALDHPREFPSEQGGLPHEDGQFPNIPPREAFPTFPDHQALPDNMPRPPEIYQNPSLVPSPQYFPEQYQREFQEQYQQQFQEQYNQQYQQYQQQPSPSGEFQQLPPAPTSLNFGASSAANILLFPLRIILDLLP